MDDAIAVDKATYSAIGTMFNSAGKNASMLIDDVARTTQCIR